MRVAAPLALRTGDREKLAKLAASRAGEAGLARRARIVLLAADGLVHTEIAERYGTPVPTVRELNMVEIFFSIITRRAIRRGTYRSVKDLVARIGEFIGSWNERCQPFV